MLPLFKPKIGSLFGMDISSTAVKVLALSRSHDHYVVEKYARIDLPENVMEGGVIKEADLVLDHIKRLLKTNQIRSRQVALAVPEGAAISRTIQVNEGLTDQEIEELLIMEADKYIPYPIEEVSLDFNVLGPSAKNPAMQEVLLVASRTENITHRVELVQRAGLLVSIVDVESYAIERAVQLLKQELPNGGEKKNIAFIEFGGTNTHLFVLHDMKIIFSREEVFGGNQLLDNIMQTFGLTRSAALLALDQGSLPENYESDVLRPFMALLFLQVKRSLQFFFSTSHHTAVDHLILAGGLAQLPRLAQLMQEQVNIPTTVANLFAHMSVASTVDSAALTHDAPRLLIACGLALRQFE